MRDWDTRESPPSLHTQVDDNQVYPSAEWVLNAREGREVVEGG